MRIAFVNNDFGIGGLQRVSAVVGKELSEKYKVYFYSMFSDQNFYEIESNFVDGQVWLDRKKFLNKCWRARRLIEKTISAGEYTPAKYSKANLDKLIAFSKSNKINVLVLSGPENTSFIPYLKSKMPELKFVAWQLSNANVYINNYAKAYKTAYLNGLTEASHVICQTDTDYRDYKQYNNSITRIYNPLTIENNKTSTLDHKFISFVSRLSIHTKGIDYLIEVASKLPDGWEVVVAGSGEGNAMEEINALVNKFDAKGKISFRGALKGKELEQHYLNSSMYIMTSRWEGFGLVLTEAMSFGLPIIAYENIGSNEVLSYGEFGRIVENGDIEAMLGEINNLLSNPSLRKEYQEKSLLRVQDFAAEKIIPQWEKLLLEVCSE